MNNSNKWYEDAIVKAREFLSLWLIVTQFFTYTYCRYSQGQNCLNRLGLDSIEKNMLHKFKLKDCFYN